MSKRKILLLATALCMVAILAVGGTLAYFTDNEQKNNVFTAGGIDIELKENFDDVTASELMPATGSAQNGTLANGVKKEVTIKNLKSDAYVRVHIAIPSLLDNGRPDFDAGANVLHFNYEKSSIGAGKWDWSQNSEDGVYEGNWNFYNCDIEGVNYNVYVVTYDSVLAKDESTVKAIHQVYLDSKVTQADVAKINNQIGTQWQIKVLAEAGQAAGFTNPFTALNTQFGVPGSYNPWTE